MQKIKSYISKFKNSSILVQCKIATTVMIISEAILEYCQCENKYIPFNNQTVIY